MPAYLLASVDVRDPAAYQANYAPAAGATVVASGGRILAAGGRSEALEGSAFASRIVILEFPSLAATLEWYRSADYQKVRPERLATATGSLIAIEGTPHTPSPGSTYCIATMEIIDADAYANQYVPPTVESITGHGGTILVGGGACEVLEGEAFGSRTVMLEFPDWDTAMGWYRSEEYQPLIALRQSATKGSLVMVEGLQP